MLGLTELLDRKPRQLSGGQRQRVALGRALVRRPKVFLMDEPLSNLDARLRLEMREELRRLHASYGITTIYVTHDQEEAMALSGRLAVLSGGRIQQCDLPMTVYDNPANLFVAEFVGSPPINVVERDGLGPMPGIEYLLAGWWERDVVLGIRPTDLAVYPSPGEGLLAAEVLITETTGSDLWVVCRANGQRLRGRAAGRGTFARGAAAYLQDRLVEGLCFRSRDRRPSAAGAGSGFSCRSTVDSVIAQTRRPTVISNAFKHPASAAAPA